MIKEQIHYCCNWPILDIKTAIQESNYDFLQSCHHTMVTPSDAGNRLQTRWKWGHKKSHALQWERKVEALNDIFYSVIKILVKILLLPRSNTLQYIIYSRYSIPNLIIPWSGWRNVLYRSSTKIQCLLLTNPANLNKMHLWDLRFSQQCLWRFKSSGMLYGGVNSYQHFGGACCFHLLGPTVQEKWVTPLWLPDPKEWRKILF